jgi:hypothetical protein
LASGRRTTPKRAQRIPQITNAFGMVGSPFYISSRYTIGHYLPF